MTDRDDTYPLLGTVLISVDAFRQAMRKNRELKARVRELKARVQQLEEAIRAHRRVLRGSSMATRDRRLWAVLGEEALDD
jgi:outer membrane murein-binding lipoprotein Lpp